MRQKRGVFPDDWYLDDRVPQNPTDGADLLSKHNISEWIELDDRKKLLVAYDSETRIRLAGARGEHVHATIEDNLFPVYDEPWKPIGGYPEDYPRCLLEQDVINYRRRRHKYFSDHASPDQSVHPFFVDLGHVDDGNIPLSSSITPCYLFFQIILAGYSGYRIYPRTGTAVMGGAVVACLTAWKCPVLRRIIMRSPIIRHLSRDDDIPFRSATDRSYDGDEPDFKTTESYWDHPVHRNELYFANFDDDDAYGRQKDDLVRQINNYFIHKFASWDPTVNLADRNMMGSLNLSFSDFSTGDVDVFIERSPGIERIPGLNNDILKLIGDYVGPMGLASPDIMTIASSFFTSRYAEMSDFNRFLEEHQESAEAGIIYSITKRALSFEVTMDHEFRDSFGQMGARLWPRNTQFIQLSPKVSLLLALMDFDISVATCMYNGVSVHCTFRGAYSLKTQTSVVTPVVYQEKRCRSRLAKYHRRGFSRMVFDPRNFRSSPQIDINALSHTIDASLTHQGDIYHNTRVLPRDLYDEDRTDLIHRFQTGSTAFKICHLNGEPCRGSYSLSLIPGDYHWKVNFISSLLSWSTEHEDFVRSVDNPHRFLVCSYVKNAIIASLNINVLSKHEIVLRRDGSHAHEDLEALDTELANLHWVSNGNGTSTGDHRSDQTFYAGPVSSARNARCTKGLHSSLARYRGKLLFDCHVFKQKSLPRPPDGAMDHSHVAPPVEIDSTGCNILPPTHSLRVSHPQQDLSSTSERGEDEPWIRQWKPPKGFLPRFLHARTWAGLLFNSSLLRESSRNPIGLNPERICQTCTKCKRWEDMVLVEQLGPSMCESCSLDMC